MTKLELVAKVAEKVDMSKKDVEKVLNGMLDSIQEALIEDKNGKVQLVGFGTFENREREGRKGRNPQTGEEIFIEGAIVPAFKAGKNFKDRVKDAFPVK